MLLIALLLGAFSFSGYLQAGMFQPPGYRATAWIYLVLFLGSAVTVMAAIGTLIWRALRRNSERPAI
jgi:hypothetical protein